MTRLAAARRNAIELGEFTRARVNGKRAYFTRSRFSASRDPLIDRVEIAAGGMNGEPGWIRAFGGEFRFRKPAVFRVHTRDVDSFARAIAVLSASFGVSAPVNAARLTRRDGQHQAQEIAPAEDAIH